MFARLSLLGILMGSAATRAQIVSIKGAGGWLETAHVEWTSTTRTDGFNVYVNGNGVTNQKLDNPLIRSYGTYWRADAMGLKAGSYTLKIVPVVSGKETGTPATTNALAVAAHDRAGFAFSGGRIPGAYNLDGTPMTGAVIVYVTQKSKDTVSLPVVTSSKGATTVCKGVQNILYSYKKGYDTRPYIIRWIGQVTDAAVMEGGDLVIENDTISKGHLTLEGVGDDALIDGWGIRLKAAANIEIRNMGVMNVNSTAGDDIGLQDKNDHIWIHNNDHFYGDAGSDEDQVKGDGAMDVKLSTYVTISYNHFWDNGKCSLLGLGEDRTTGLYINYHHNWFDHSDSRHPRVRFYSAHVYNNYYDGNDKYGAGSTMGSSIFMEGNYFRKCKYPMLTSLQGSDVWDSIKQANVAANGTFSGEAGGTIKAWDNYIEGAKRFVAYGDTKYPNPTVDFDAYVAASRTEKVPATVKSASGANVYNNFDTDVSVMYTYTADAPEVAKTKVIANAGREQSGDFKWTFNNAVDDTTALVNTGLKTAIVGYKTALVCVQGEGACSATSGIGAKMAVVSNPVRIDAKLNRLIVADGWTVMSVEIYTVTGERILQSKGGSEISLAGLNKGIHLAKIRTDRGSFEHVILN